MKMAMEVRFTDPVMEPEYPTDITEDFDSPEDFIQFNVEQIEEIIDTATYYQQVLEKLLLGDYVKTVINRILYFTVSDIDIA